MHVQRRSPAVSTAFAVFLLVLCRLAPMDIHRLHASVSGRVLKIRQRGTRFMGSEFAAIHSRMDVMTENDR